MLHSLIQIKFNLIQIHYDDAKFYRNRVKDRYYIQIDKWQVINLNLGPLFPEITVLITEACGIIPTSESFHTF